MKERILKKNLQIAAVDSATAAAEFNKDQTDFQSVEGQILIDFKHYYYYYYCITLKSTFLSCTEQVKYIYF